jgi:hypothetical protein
LHNNKESGESLIDMAARAGAAIVPVSRRIIGFFIIHDDGGKVKSGGDGSEKLEASRSQAGFRGRQ